MSSETYKKRRAAGVCVFCGKSDLTGGTGTMCLVCKMDKREINRQKWPIRSEKVNESHREYLRKRREAAVSEGICIMCLKRPAVNGRTTCLYCSQKNAYNQRLKRDGKRVSDLGGCPKCGKPPVDGYKLCADCLPKYQALMLYARSMKKGENHFEKSIRNKYKNYNRKEVLSSD